ncbi:MAG: hypothetical protein IPM54_06005 [Polyangiaceae bacterium]|nr:hypothetical protein [Polyangiaceae bacterium]
MGTTWTPWHLLLAVLLRQRAPGDREIQSEVKLTADALRLDFVFLPQEDATGRAAGTLKKLWGLLTKHVVCEFKSVGRPYRRFNFDRFFTYITTYYTNEVEALGRRSELCGVLLVTKRSPTMDEDVHAYGLHWRDLGDGYWQLEGCPFKIVVVEIEVVADAEDDDVLRFLAGKQPRTVEGRRWLAKQLGTKEIQMKMHELEGFDEVLQTLLQSLPPEQVLSAYAPEERLAGLAPEQVLSVYAPEERLAGLAPEQVLSAYAPEERLAGLAPEQVLLTLPDEVLHALSDSYIDSLSEPTRTMIRKRIGR